MICLLNQVVVITGGSRGIGAASAVLFAKAGADVVITYTKNAKAANSVVENVKKEGRT